MSDLSFAVLHEGAARPGHPAGDEARRRRPARGVPRRGRPGVGAAARVRSSTWRAPCCSRSCTAPTWTRPLNYPGVDGPLAPRPSTDRHTSPMTFDQLATSILAGKPATEDDALAVLRAHDDELLDVVAAAGRLRRAHFGNTVKVNYLVNLKSGLCPENCNYCSQALGSTAPILKYSWLKTDEALEQAARRPRGRRHPRLHGQQRARPERPRHRQGHRDGRRDQGREPRRRGLRLSRTAQGRPGRAAARTPASTPTTTTSTPPSRTTTQIVQTHTYADRVDTVQQGQDRRPLPLLRPDRRPGRDRRAARRGALRAARARVRLDPGQLPDALRRHAATRTRGSSTPPAA